MDDARIASIEWGVLTGTRPRPAGCNARLGEHGATVRVPIARLTTDDGAQGFGASTVTVEEASLALGKKLLDLFDCRHGATPSGAALDFPLWDLMATRSGKPVYALAAQMSGLEAPGMQRVRCYDTSLYIDDLHLQDDDEAASMIADEACAGLAQGHRSFKIKVGRGARHMPLEDGLRRDIAVVRAVRAAVGDDAEIMLDANNGYNLNLTKSILLELADCDIHWMEEPFHEDGELYVDLKAWLAAQGLATMIADGEGQASPDLLKWAQTGLVDVVQFDILSYGFSSWLGLGRRLDDWNVCTAPHHYGRCYGNYVTGHLAAVVDGLAFVEWDEADTPGLDRAAYVVEEGALVLPQRPGFGLRLDDEVFGAAVQESGYRLSWT